ncbi:hypothetical protein DC852_00515 [Vibrio parahaemolyticus]|nr:hypothetical protein [Vibrio parahaemolyticus]EXJ41366.1 putative 2-dehydropantoate 2-reductase [Vibrio parahaemolyticus VPTS-2010]EGR2988976.1 hypothetical protein [Vibrio parahaemolyticus]EGR3240557.1 hypothetical protein [Vibrio parahaemolyticus]EGR3501707.1 hypothetical protein [Vibrio parahaemolyticus]
MGDSVVFDSGAVVLSANSNLTITAINTGDSSSSLPVKQLVLDDSSSSIIEITGNQAKFESGILSMALRVIR